MRDKIKLVYQHGNVGEALGLDVNLPDKFTVKILELRKKTKSYSQMLQEVWNDEQLSDEELIMMIMLITKLMDYDDLGKPQVSMGMLKIENGKLKDLGTIKNKQDLFDILNKLQKDMDEEHGNP